MAEQLGSAVLTLSVDDRAFNAGLTRARQNVDRQLKPVNTLKLSPSGGADVAGVASAIGSGFAGAAIAAAAVAAGVAAVGYAATRSAGEIQRLNAAFTGLTGSAEAAKQLRQQLFELSKTTPFRNEDILQASQRFLAVGIEVDKLSGTLNRVGALAAQSGQPLERLALIYAQVYAKGRLQGEENLQLLEAGVDLSQELAQVTGLTGSALQDAMSKGQIGIQEFNQALVLATGDMTALQEAGKSVDTQFNNIGDNLGQVFGGFAQSVAPALSAAFQVVNDIFDSAFPDLASIENFFAPLTQEAKRFAGILGSNPALIETIGAALRSVGEVIINGLVQGLQYVNDLLSKADGKQLVQGLISAEYVLRKALLTAQALGATLTKNAELSFRAATNPVQFGKDIFNAGGFAKFFEKEYKQAAEAWGKASSANPLPFPDITKSAEDQTRQVAGDLSNKLRGAIEEQVAGGLTTVRDEISRLQKELENTPIGSAAFQGLDAAIVRTIDNLRQLEGTAAQIRFDNIQSGFDDRQIALSLSNIRDQLQAAQTVVDNFDWSRLEYDPNAAQQVIGQLLEVEDQLQKLDGQKATITVELLQQGLENGSLDNTINNLRKQQQSLQTVFENSIIGSDKFYRAKQALSAVGEKLKAAGNALDAPARKLGSAADSLNSAMETTEQAAANLRSVLEGSFKYLTDAMQGQVLATSTSDINRAIQAGFFSESKVDWSNPQDILSAGRAARSVLDATNSLTQSNTVLRESVDKLTDKNWNVNVAVNANTGNYAVNLG